LRGSESNYPEWTKDKITEGKFIEVEMLIQNMGKILSIIVPLPSTMIKRESMR
jgi:hypothetical protein